ncbi:MULTISPECIES: DUF3168 domain-containing protein [unclassified Streptomyces]|uniref:DUF3168 domain-containing protein n=1 Tax=unclassified Streptomyces TaxID=2593676 RepID=UPI0022706E05|nr:MULTISPECIES: DUF3168 domain-containing protein [unclassified Streptomyces]MCY0919604.1 DUF3168 domain-containing protein [Streptomyces sp. H27-G5]MCY0957214.1 DUF3168 domain-containing protein [Streptomyces sp. H27-H5]
MTTARSALEPVQAALYVRLSGDQTLGDLVTGVFDHVPEADDLDYVTIGEATEIPDNHHGGFGREIVAALHVWTRARGHGPGLRIAARLVELLDHQPLTIAGHTHIATRHEFSQTLTDPDPPGDIRHVSMRFRIITEQE